MRLYVAAQAEMRTGCHLIDRSMSRFVNMRYQYHYDCIHILPEELLEGDAGGDLAELLEHIRDNRVVQTLGENGRKPWLPAGRNYLRSRRLHLVIEVLVQVFAKLQSNSAAPRFHRCLTHVQHFCRLIY